jgi:hypothetical protein
LRCGWEKREKELLPALVERDASVGKSLKVAAHINGAGKVLKHGDSLHVKVAQHRIALPATKEADYIAVDEGSDGRHGSGGTEGFQGDINRVVAK